MHHRTDLYNVSIYTQPISKILSHPFLIRSISTARNDVGARLCFYSCVWFCSQGGKYLTRYTPRDQVHLRTRYTPRPGIPPKPGTPPRSGTPPGTRYTPLDQVHPQTRYTPLGPGPPRPGTPPGLTQIFLIQIFLFKVFFNSNFFNSNFLNSIFFFF